MAALLLESEISEPEAGGGELKVKVSVTEEPPLTLVGVAIRPVRVGTTTGASVVVAVFDPPLNVAVTVTVVETVTVFGCTNVTP